MSDTIPVPRETLEKLCEAVLRLRRIYHPSVKDCTDDHDAEVCVCGLVDAADALGEIRSEVFALLSASPQPEKGTCDDCLNMGSLHCNHASPPPRTMTAEETREACAKLAERFAELHGDMALYGLPVNARERESAEAAATRIANSIRQLPLTRKPAKEES